MTLKRLNGRQPADCRPIQRERPVSAQAEKDALSNTSRGGQCSITAAVGTQRCIGLLSLTERKIAAVVNLDPRQPPTYCTARFPISLMSSNQNRNAKVLDFCSIQNAASDG